VILTFKRIQSTLYYANLIASSCFILFRFPQSYWSRTAYYQIWETLLLSLQSYTGVSSELY